MLQSATTQLASGSRVVEKNDQDRSIKSQSRGRPRSEESEEAILAATIQLLSEKPLRDISMEEIAQRLVWERPPSINGGRAKHVSLWRRS